MTSRIVPTGSVSKSFTIAKTTDIMEIIQHAAPNKDGLNIIYSLAGGLEFRIAKLAAMVTNTMAATLMARSITAPDMTAISKFNESMNALDEIKNREWAFTQAGLTQRDMVKDLNELIGFNLTVQTRLASLKSPSTTPADNEHIARHARWTEIITKVAEPREVEEWKLSSSWEEYLEECNNQPQMTEEEHRALDKVDLGGRKQNYAEYVSQIIDTITNIEGEALEFYELSTDLQMRLLESMCSEDKRLKLRKSALKNAKDKNDLHTRRTFIDSFIAEAQLALAHPKFADKGEVQGQDEHDDAVAHRQSQEAQAEANADAIA